ncbi:MAG TPA: RNA polymerase subunit sigma, partial [Pseudomonas sp.]|nr:RNA polymerase subunit sigma [Pseudomonas sp.]
HNARQTYRAEQPLTVWVQAICRYELADHYRTRGRQAAQTDWLDEADELLAVQDNAQAEARRDLGKLLQQLPPRQRLPIVHVKLEGRSVEETARLTGLSSSAIKVGIHRGLKALAAKIRGGA